jgi:2,4-dienoyl-CoA reductase-like NADH-dependent reductase (Old Yellow Enzyme family)
MGDSNPAATFGYVATELGKRGLAFLCAREAPGDDRIGPQLKKAFGGAFIANERFNKEAAEETIRKREADAVAFGKAFIANPDLPRRFAEGAPLNQWDAQTFYSQGPKGYLDYPALA